MGSVSPDLLLAAALLGSLASCQAVFGDFELVEPEPAEIVLGLFCDPDEFRCTGAALETCAPDRQAFVLVQACATPAECNLNARACRPCAAGELMCRGNVLERCQDGAWVADATCESAELCQVAADRRSGSCRTPACDPPGALRCDGAKLERCAEGRDRWEPLALCATPELCDPAAASQAQATGQPPACRTPACEGGGFSCNGATLQQCGPGRERFVDVAACGAPELCSAARESCGACTPGEVECNGRELRRCGEAALWEPVAVCASTAHCNAGAARCEQPQCSEPGRMRCSVDLPLLEECSDELTWKQRAVCANAALCSAEAGRCLPPACSVGETRCRGYAYQRCSDDRTRFVDVETCSASEICDVARGCAPGPCEDGSVRCNGARLERCAGGAYRPELVCATAALCDPAAGCQEPVCGGALPAFECRGAILRECPPSRDRWIEFLTCPEGSICDPVPAPGTGQAECDACVPGSFRCRDTLLERCSSDGQAYELVMSCEASCTVTDGVPSCL